MQFVIAVSAFDADLLIRLNDDNFQLDHPNPVFYLQDDVYFDDAAADDIPPDAEYGDMNQPAKRHADEIEFETFDQYLNSEFMVNQGWRDGYGKGCEACKR